MEDLSNTSSASPPAKDDAIESQELQSLVREAIESSDDLDQQVARLHRLFDERPELFDPAEARSVYEMTLVYRMRGTDRRIVKFPPSNPSRRTLDSIAATSDLRAASLIDSWMLPEGLLGDYTAEMLKPLAAAELEQAKGHRQNATFFEWLAGQLPAGVKVRQHFKAGQVQRRWDEIRGTKAAKTKRNQKAA